MPRPEKVEAVTDIKTRIQGARAVFLAEYAGLSVKAQQRLRRELKAKGAEFKVVKMTLARRAAAELELDSLDELLVGPTGVAYADDDPVSAAKVLRDFARDHEVFSVKGGLLGSDFLTPERIAALAEIESRDVLLAKIAGAMKAPLANAAGLFAALPRNAAYALQQLLDKKQAAEPAGAAEAAATESATATTTEHDESEGSETVADAAEAEPTAAVDDESTDEVKTAEASADEASEEPAAEAAAEEE